MNSEVSYLRLDGDTPVAQRQQIVDEFNSDASIDLLLVTTHVGGQGLNLTGMVHTILTVSLFFMLQLSVLVQK